MTGPRTLDGLYDHALPVVARVVGGRFRRAVKISAAGLFESSSDDALECCARAAVRLAEKFRRVADGVDDQPASVDNYAATVSHNVVNDYFRARAPMRTSFANRIRRTLDEPSFAVWEFDSLVVAGYAGWRTAGPPRTLMPHESSLAQVVEEGGLAVQPWHLMDLPAFTRLLEAVFDLTAGPVEIHSLTSTLAAVLRVPDGGLVSAHEGSIASRSPLAGEALSTLEVREQLQRFWDCARQLRREWACALLLNLPSLPDSGAAVDSGEARQRDRRLGSRRGEIEVLPFAGVASIADIGRALSLSSEDYSRLGKALNVSFSIDAADPERSFYELWPHLPLSDRVIAQLLDTSKQIAALRRSAIRQLVKCMSPDSDRARSSARCPAV